MTLSEMLLPEFEQEMATTRRLIERVPAEKAEWRAHPRSTPMGQLAVHLATLAGLGATALSGTEQDMNPPGGAPFRMPPFTTTAAVLEMFDANVAQTRAAIARTSDADFQVRWSLKNAGHVIFTQPRSVVMRSMVINHIIHHRGQLSVYLRLNDVPLPSIYGPTADS